MDSTQNIISFCTGYGGIELGLRRISSDFRTVCYVEVEAFAITNLVAKIEQGQLDEAPIWSDIKTFNGKPFRGKVHGIIGGYPCQPFSAAGKRKGTDDPRHLWPYIEEHLCTIRPVWCFFENVSGHLTLGFREVQQSLRDLGYSVEAGLFTAAEIGTPHKRQRLFILGYSKKCCGRGKYGNNNGPQKPHWNWDEQPQRRGGTKPKPQTAQVAGTGEQLADTTGIGTQRYEPARNNQSKRQVNELRYDRWPARPGQEQYCWEEPRTVESGMGRTVDGFTSRVDELRLLGNGVVPQTAELAFRELTRKLI